MSLEATFEALYARSTELREAFADLRMAVVEDGPRSGAPALLDQLGDATTDLLGWLEEAVETAAAAFHQAKSGDRTTLQSALLRCHEQVRAIDHHFATDLFTVERLLAVADLGRERGRAWKLWSSTVQQSLGHCRHGLLAANQAVLDAWREITALVGGGVGVIGAVGVVGVRPPDRASPEPARPRRLASARRTPPETQPRITKRGGRDGPFPR